MKFSQSIVSRIVLLFAVLLVFSVLLTGFLVYRRASVSIESYSRDRILHDAELANQTFYSLLDEVSTDVSVIARGPVVQRFVEDPSPESSESVERLFRTVLEQKKAYFQLRLIGVEDQGREVIRMDKQKGLVRRSDSLQQKGDRDYFKEALDMPEGGIYYSRVDLNQEFGVVSEPKIPTLRVATPLYTKSRSILGLIVVNLDLTGFYQTLSQIPAAGSELYLIDEEGQYLFAPDSKLQFGKQLGHDRKFYDDFESEANGEYEVSGDFIPIKKKGTEIRYLGVAIDLPYFDGKRRIRLFSVIDQKSVLRTAEEVRAYSLRAIALLGILVALITLFFARYFSKFLTQITDALGNYEELDTRQTPLPIDRKDEIGVLARTFLSMKGRIDQNMERLNTALEEEQKAKNQRDEFLQNMSHEMRTPLNAILGLTHLMKKNEQDPDQRHLLKAMERSAQSLSGLVYDVLDHQNLLEGKVAIDMKPTQIAGLLRDIHSTYQYEAIQKGLEFELNIDPQLEEQVFLSDALRLSQIVINLVTNAIKYTRAGKIILQASISNGRTPELEIGVIDTGIGIKPENLERINDRFFRVDEGVSGKNYGYGLGLSIVKQLTALFGGQLYASSEMDCGSSFTVRIPAERVTPTENLNLHGQELVRYAEFAKPRRVLHIEDDLSTLDLVEALFKKTHVEFIPVTNTEEAKRLLSKGDFDLVISDLYLSSDKIEGELIQWMAEGVINCPLIVVSGLSAEQFDLKGVYYLEKPFDVDCFKDLVYTILGTPIHGSPNFRNLYVNYDQNLHKIGQVLELIEKEFQVYLNRIHGAAESRNQKEWEGIRHKLINHINNLDLQKLGEMLPEHVSQLQEGLVKEIGQLFRHYQCCIRYEACSISSKNGARVSKD